MMKRYLYKFNLVLVILLLVVTAAQAVCTPKVKAATGITKIGSIDGGANPLSNPFGNVAADTLDNVYIPDSYNNRIQKYDKNENYVTKWGNTGTGAGDLDVPTGIAIDNTGNIYVVENGQNRIQKFTSDGDFISTFGWGVSDGSSAFQVCTSNCQSGISGSGSGQFKQPVGIGIDNDENLLIVDQGNHRIQKFTSDGDFISTFGWGVSDGSSAFQVCTSNCQSGISGSGNGQFNYPLGIKITVDKIFVTDSNNDRIEVFDSSYNYVSQWGPAGNNDAQISGPFGIDMDSAGNIYVTNMGDFTVKKFDSSGNYVSQYHEGMDNDGPTLQPTGVLVSKYGKLYITNVGKSRVEILCDNDVSTNGCMGAEQSSSDSDSDNLPNSVEQAAPNNGDANNDGTLDSTQPNVTSLLNTISGTYSVLQTNCTTNTTTSMSPESSDHKDTAYDYTQGLMNFTATGCGSTATITQYFYSNLDASKVTARKYNPTTNTYTTIDNATITNVTIGSQKALKVTYTITDNGPLDLNPTTGTITDPSGPAVLTVGVPNTGL